MRVAALTCVFATLAGVGDATQVNEVDVLIVGGGATGSYAAVRLREDYGKSVLVVEKSNRLVSLDLILENLSLRYVT